MCNSNFEKKLPPTVSHHSKRQFKRTGSRMGILLLLPLLWAVLFSLSTLPEWMPDFPTDARLENRESRARSCRLRKTGGTAPPDGFAGKRTLFIRPWVQSLQMLKKEMKTPDADETGAAETTASGAAPSTSEEKFTVKRSGVGNSSPIAV